MLDKHRDPLTSRTNLPINSLPPTSKASSRHDFNLNTAKSIDRENQHENIPRYQHNGSTPKSKAAKPQIVRNLNLKLKDTKPNVKEVYSPASVNSSDLSYKILNEILNSQHKDRNALMQRVHTKINENKKNQLMNNTGNTSDLEPMRSPMHDNDEIKNIQNLIDATLRDIQNYTDRIETYRKSSGTKSNSAKDHLVEIQSDYFRAKQKLEELQTKRILLKEQYQIDEYKDKLKLIKLDRESYLEELKKLEDAINSKEDHIVSKEKAIRTECDTQIKTFEEALATIQQQKLGIMSKLEEAINAQNQTFEQKAMLKEDLNARLIQRAEIVGHREELDDIFAKIKDKNKNDIELHFEEMTLVEEIKKLNENIMKTEQKLNISTQQREIKLSGIREINNRIASLQQVYENLSKERNIKVSQHSQEIEQLETTINAKAATFSIPEIDIIFQELCNKHNQYIEKEILQRQLILIEDEEKTLTDKFHTKGLSLMETIGMLKAREEEGPEVKEEIDKLQDECEQLKLRYDLRKEAISKWKNEVLNALGNEQYKAIQGFENHNALFEEIKLRLKEKAVSESLQMEFCKMIEQYLSKIEDHELYLHQKIHEETKIQEEMKALEEKIESINLEKAPFEEEISIFELDLANFQSKKQKSELTLKDKKAEFERRIAAETEEAFSAYMEQQSETFSEIAKSYGQESANNIKDQHRKEFEEITRANKIKIFERFMDIQRDLKYINKAIDNNIKSVDYQILPNLKKNGSCGNEVKALVVALRKQHLTLLETEDEVAGQVEAIIQTKEGKLRSIQDRIVKSQTLNQLKEAKEFVTKKYEDCEKEINSIENRLLTYDEVSTRNSLDEKKANEEFKVLSEKLRELQSNNESPQKPLNIPEMEREVRKLKKQLEELEMQKIAIEQKLVEQNYLNDDINDRNLTTSDVADDSIQGDILDFNDKENFEKIGIADAHSPSGKKAEISPIRCYPQSPSAEVPLGKTVKANLNEKLRQSKEQTRFLSPDQKKVPYPDDPKSMLTPVNAGPQKRLPSSSKPEDIRTERHVNSMTELQQKNRPSDKKEDFIATVRPNKFQDSSLKQHLQIYKNFSQTHTFSSNLSPEGRIVPKDFSSPKSVTISLKNLTPQNEHIRSDVKAFTQPFKPNSRCATPQGNLLKSANTSQINISEQRLGAIREKPLSHEVSLQVEDMITPNKTHDGQPKFLDEYCIKPTIRSETVITQASVDPEVVARRLLEIGESTNKRSRSVESHSGKAYQIHSESIPEKKRTNYPNYPDSADNNAKYENVQHRSQLDSSSFAGKLNNGNFRFNLSYCNIQDVAFFEAIRPLLEGRFVFKKFTCTQSLRKAAFDPLDGYTVPPETCGYGVRSLKLSQGLDKFEFRQTIRPGVEATLSVASIIRPLVPQLTMDILKIQKKSFDTTNPFAKESKLQEGLNSISTKALLLQRGPNIGANLEKYLACSFYPFSILLEKGGRLDFVASSYGTFKECINGINALLKYKKSLGQMKNKIEIAL